MVTRAGTPSDDPARMWDTWLNAEIYREYVETFSVYRRVESHGSPSLARSSASARRVLDRRVRNGRNRSRLPGGSLARTRSSIASMRHRRCSRLRASTIEDPRARFALRQALSASMKSSVKDSTGHSAMPPLDSSPDRPQSSAPVARILDVGRPLRLQCAARAARWTTAWSPVRFQISLAHTLAECGPDDLRSVRGLFRRTTFASCYGVHGLRRGGALAPFRYRARQGELMELMQVPALAIQLAPELGYDALSRRGAPCGGLQ